MKELWKWYVPLQMLGIVRLLISVGSWNDILKCAYVRSEQTDT